MTWASTYGIGVQMQKLLPIKCHVKYVFTKFVSCFAVNFVSKVIEIIKRITVGQSNIFLRKWRLFCNGWHKTR